jgi:hypothetical protein
MAAALGSFLIVTASARAQTPIDSLRERVRAKDWAGALAQIAQLPAEFTERAEIRYLTARLYEEQDKDREALAALPKDTSSLPARVVRDIAERRARGPRSSKSSRRKTTSICARACCTCAGSCCFVRARTTPKPRSC